MGKDIPTLEILSLSFHYLSTSPALRTAAHAAPARAALLTRRSFRMTQVQVYNVLKSLLELLSDEVSMSLSYCTLDMLLDVVERSWSGPTKAVEVGTMDVLVELLADADDSRDAERILLLLKLLCKCPEGCLAFAEHDLSVAQAMADSLPLLPSRPARKCRVEPATAEARSRRRRAPPAQAAPRRGACGARP